MPEMVKRLFYQAAEKNNLNETCLLTFFFFFY